MLQTQPVPCMQQIRRFDGQAFRRSEGGDPLLLIRHAALQQRQRTAAEIMYVSSPGLSFWLRVAGMIRQHECIESHFAMMHTNRPQMRTTSGLASFERINSHAHKLAIHMHCVLARPSLQWPRSKDQNCACWVQSRSQAALGPSFLPACLEADLAVSRYAYCS